MGLQFPPIVCMLMLPSYCTFFCITSISLFVYVFQEWNDFEIAHGNEDTFKEMLRVRRSVTNQFALANNATDELLRQAAQIAEQKRIIQEAAKARAGRHSWCLFLSLSML
jgi:hypothetical protein